MMVATGIDQPTLMRGRGALYTGGIAAILASTCHHISFLLATLGLSNTKILYIVTIADWSRMFLIAVALIGLFISYQHIWRISSAYKAGRDSGCHACNICTHASVHCAMLRLKRSNNLILFFLSMPISTLY